MLDQPRLRVNASAALPSCFGDASNAACIPARAAAVCIRASSASNSSIEIRTAFWGVVLGNYQGAALHHAIENAAKLILHNACRDAEESRLFPLLRPEKRCPTGRIASEDGYRACSLERIRDSTCSQTLGSDSISICGFMKARAYQGYPAQLTGLVL